MSNDPRDIVVDLSKLMQGQSQTPVQIPIPAISPDSISAMISSCNESAELVGHEQFTRNGKSNQAEDD